MLIVTSLLNINVVYASLTQEHVDQLREMLKIVDNDLQNNSTENASNALQTIISNITESVCNMPVGCENPGSLQTGQADEARTPLNDALKAIQTGNTSLAKDQITNANSSLSKLV